MRLRSWPCALSCVCVGWLWLCFEAAVCVVQLTASRVSLRVVLVLFSCVLPAASLWVSVRVLGGLFLEAATLSAADHDHFSTVFDYYLELWFWKLRCAMLGWHYFVFVVH